MVWMDTLFFFCGLSFFFVLIGYFVKFLDGFLCWGCFFLPILIKTNQGFGEFKKARLHPMFWT